MPGDGVDDLGDGDLDAGYGGFFAEGFAGQLDGDFSAFEHSQSMDFGEGAFEFAGVLVEFGGDELDDFVGGIDAAELGFFEEDGDAGFKIGFVDAGDQALIEATDEAFFEPFNFYGFAVGTEDNLFAGLVEGVKGVEEFFLRAFSFGEELHVVDDEHLGMAVFVAEIMQFALFHRLDKVIDKGFTGEIGDVGLVLLF